MATRLDQHHEPVERPHPSSHRCTIGTIDYSRVLAGYLVCAVDSGGCGREWRLVEVPGGHVWQPHPHPGPRR